MNTIGCFKNKKPLFMAFMMHIDMLAVLTWNFNEHQ